MPDLPAVSFSNFSDSTDCDGLLIDTYRKDSGKGLLDYFELEQLARIVRNLHDLGRELWLAGAIGKHQLAGLSETGVDVVCVRAAACNPEAAAARLGSVSTSVVRGLVATFTSNRKL